MKPMGGDQALGGIYEMRTYTYEPGSIPELLKRWEASLPEREKHSPLAAGMWTEFGGLNRWMYIWSYKDLNHRADTGEKDRRLALWSTGPGPPGEQDHGAGQLLPYALAGPRFLSLVARPGSGRRGRPRPLHYAGTRMVDDIERLRTNPGAPDQLVVSGLVYDLSNGASHPSRHHQG